MKHVSTFNAINDLAHDITEKDLNAARRLLDDYTERNQKFSKALNEATTNYILTGVGRIPDGHNWNGWLRMGARTRFQWDAYFKKLSVDLKRPYVFLPSFNTLVLARRKYTDPLAGYFLLTAVESTNQYNMTDAPVMFRKTTDRWYFAFQNTMQPLVDAWLVECKTNPEFRRALKL